MSQRLSKALITLLLGLGMLAVPGRAASQGAPVIAPSDSRLVPSPLDTSDPGTTWTCRVIGTDAACIGTLTIRWQEQDGPDDWCSVPLTSVDGTFTRNQTRYYAYDSATGTYLEDKRLIHLSQDENLTPDPASSAYVVARSRMTWTTSFHVPGDLGSRITRKQGIDTSIKRPDGGIVVLDVGQKTEDLTIAPGEDFDFRGRWDIALGDPATELGEVCSALGL
jgi:hypothetical protein